MSDDLIPDEQIFVTFQGDDLVVVLFEDEPYIPLAPICEYLGLSWTGQSERIKRDPVLSEVRLSLRVTRKESKRGAREMLCLPLKYLNGWLFGIAANRVKKELQEKIIQYQRECYEVLFQAFQSRAIEATKNTTSLAQIRDMALAIAQMAEQQMLLESRISQSEERLDKAALVVGNLSKRLGMMEKKLHPLALISDEQAAEISLQVKALATLMGGYEDHYRGVFAELYRRFGVSSYKLIKLSQYESVLNFLEDWREQGEER